MIQSVERVISILEYIARNGNNVRLQDIAGSLDMKKSTVHHFIRTLLTLGYVQQDNRSPRYGLTPRMLQLMPPEISNISLKSRFRPVLEQLTATTGETSYLTIQLGTYMRHELKCDPQRSVRISLEVGKDLDILNSAIGNIFLAHSPILRRQLKGNILPGKEEDWQRQLDLVLHQGYAEDYERLEKELNCVAVPVLEKGLLVAAISLSGPSYRFRSVEMEQAIILANSLVSTSGMA